jgi:hypothetical protein
MRLTQITQLFNELGIPMMPPVFSDSQSLIPRIKYRIYRRTTVEHIATKYYHAADMAREREINLSHVPNAEMITDCFAQPLPQRACLKKCEAMGMIRCCLRNGLGNGLGNGLWIGISTGPEYGCGMHGNGHGIVLVLEMEKASGKPLVSKLFGHFCFKEKHNV